MQNEKRRDLQAMYPKLQPGQSWQGFEPLFTPQLKVSLVRQMLCPQAKEHPIFYVGYCNNVDDTLEVHCFNSAVPGSSILPIQNIIDTGIKLGLPRAWLCRTNLHSTNCRIKWDELQITAVQVAAIMQNFLLIDYFILKQKEFISYSQFEKTGKHAKIHLAIESAFNKRFPHAANL